MNEQFDLIIIGAGPGGYETAAMAAHEGLNVALVERDLLGGTCLNRGCIPTKALCASAGAVSTLREAAAWGITIDGMNVDYAAAAARKDTVVKQLRDGVAMLMNDPHITVVQGTGRLIDATTVAVDDRTLTAPHIIIATGSSPASLPIEGADKAINSDQLLAMTTLPASMCIVGGGVIGMEFAAILNAYGVDVTVVEYCKEILPPFDKDIAKRLRTVLSKRGINFAVGAAVKSITGEPGALEVHYDSKGRDTVVTCEMVLMAVGRRAVLPEGLEAAGVTTGRRGIEVDDNMRTSAPSVYAIGDVNARCMLAHAATAQGRRALAHIMHRDDATRMDVVPSAVFTTPELAMVGLTEQQAADAGHELSVGKAFFRANGKAIAMGEPDGLVKIVVDKATRAILGCHICGPHAADLIQEIAVAMQAGLIVDTVKATIHGHPTLGEVVATALASC